MTPCPENAVYIVLQRRRRGREGKEGTDGGRAGQREGRAWWKEGGGMVGIRKLWVSGSEGCGKGEGIEEDEG